MVQLTDVTCLEMWRGCSVVVKAKTGVVQESLDFQISFIYFWATKLTYIIVILNGLFCFCRWCQVGDVSGDLFCFSPSRAGVLVIFPEFPRTTRKMCVRQTGPKYIVYFKFKNMLEFWLHLYFHPHLLLCWPHFYRKKACWGEITEHGLKIQTTRHHLSRKIWQFQFSCILLNVDETIVLASLEHGLDTTLELGKQWNGTSLVLSMTNTKPNQTDKRTPQQNISSKIQNSSF